MKDYLPRKNNKKEFEVYTNNNIQSFRKYIPELSNVDFQEEFNQCTSGCRFVDAEKTIKLLQSTLVFKLVIINID